jgi:hypothetical protein
VPRLIRRASSHSIPWLGKGRLNRHYLVMPKLDQPFEKSRVLVVMNF